MKCNRTDRKCWILQDLRNVRPLFIVQPNLSKTKVLRILNYKLPGRLGFWFILGFAGNAWCNPIPVYQMNLAKNTIAATVIPLKASPVLTENSEMKFPGRSADLREISHSATDLKSTSSFLRLRDLQGSTIGRGVDVTHETAQTNGRSQALDRSTDRSSSGMVVSQSSSVAQNQCWRVPIAECFYFQSRVRLNPEQAEAEVVDPELGVLRISPIEGENNELGSIQAEELAIEPTSGALDPDLGILRLQERTTLQPPVVFPTTPRQPTVFLIPRIDYFQTSNVFSDVDPVDDGLIRTGATLFYAPPLGSRTFLITSIDANLIRYSNLGDLNYDEFRLRAGIYQRLTARMSGEIGWSNQKLFRSDTGLRQIFGGERFINDNSIRFELSRQDSLSPRLALNTFYQFRWSFVDPDDRSRLLNSVIATLSYRLSPKLQTALDYQFTWSHFTQQDRDDLYHQLVGRLTYNFTQRGQLNVFTGFSFGNSTDDRIDFNSFIFGVGLTFNLPLF